MFWIPEMCSHLKLLYLPIYLFLAQFELDFANANKHVLTKIYAWYNRQISMLNSQNNIH